MITLAFYNPAWPELFEKEKVALQKVLGDLAVRIEHIGSTAIPGIYAKPVIDILIGVSDLQRITQNEIQKIESLGYQYNPVFESVLPYRRYFQKNNAEGIRTHQIHLVTFPSQWYEKHILFRDHVRENADVARAYEALKLSLAAQLDNTLDYANAKTNFCQSVDQKAFFDFSINKPFIETKRLIGFIPQLACCPDLVSMFTAPIFIKCYGVAFSEEKIQDILQRDMNQWNQHGYGTWQWFDKVSHHYVGRCGLKIFDLDGKKETELGYAIRPEYWGKDIAAEMSLAALDFAKHVVHLKNVCCFTMPRNKQSLRVMQKLGFQYEKDFMHIGLEQKLHRLFF